MALDTAAPITRDSIFRIASLSKPMVAAAAMILVEECRLRLDESIEPWLPELAQRRVLRTTASEPDDIVPALRAITLRDLLTFRMGFGSVLAMPNTAYCSHIDSASATAGGTKRISGAQAASAGEIR